MNAETPAPTQGTGALASAGWPESRVRRIGPPCGCAIPGVHSCGLEVEPSPVCDRRCQAADLEQLRRRGETHGGCLCSPIPWGAAS